MDVKARDHVVEHRQALEQADFLECAREPEPRALVRRQADEIDAIEDDSAGVRLIKPAHQVEQRRFAGPVRPDDREYDRRAERSAKCRAPPARRRTSCAALGAKESERRSARHASARGRRATVIGHSPWRRLAFAEGAARRIRIGLHDSARHEQHDERERQPVEDETKIAESAQQLGQEREQDRAPDRPDQRPHAADDHHGENRE